MVRGHGDEEPKLKEMNASAIHNKSCSAVKNLKQPNRVLVLELSVTILNAGEQNEQYLFYMLPCVRHILGVHRGP